MAISYESYSNPQYLTADSSIILCTLIGTTVNGVFLGNVPYHASLNDSVQFGQDLYATIVANAGTIPIAAYASPSSPTLQQQAVALIANPVMVVTCTSIPALDGSYAVPASTQSYITGISAAYNAGLGLPSGTDTFSWPDVDGAAHPWPGPQFLSFAQGVMMYVYSLTQVAGGYGDSLPSPAITIA